ncbi:MAG: hypothetical protein PHQ36_14225 [Anaerolineales bacterium]|nr:hypothetical protein [Anaerolineales bacterium]
MTRFFSEIIPARKIGIESLGRDENKKMAIIIKSAGSQRGKRKGNFFIWFANVKAPNP